MAQIFGRDLDIIPPKRHTVHIPELDCDVLLQEMDIKETMSQEGKTGIDGSIALLSLMIVDEAGSRLFDSDEGREKLSKLPRSVATALFEAAMSLQHDVVTEIGSLQKNS